MDFLLNAVDYYRPGGFIMMLIMALSLWMWVLICERIVAFQEMDRQDADLNQAMLALQQPSSLPAGAGVCRQVISGFAAQRTGVRYLDQRALDQHALVQKPRLQRHLSTIVVLAAAAPLLGLLGTVSGMLVTFDVIALSGTGNAKALSGGISQALVTTQGGLLVGIPGFFMSRLLSRRASTMERRLTETLMALKRMV